MTVRVINKHSVIRDRVPGPSEAQYGELLLNIHPESPGVYFKDAAGHMIKVGGLLQPATTTRLGGIKVGHNLAITSDGTLSARAYGALEYKGVRNFTRQAPLDPLIGDLYVNNTQGIIDDSWTGISGKTCIVGEMAIWGGERWDLLGETPTQGVVREVAGVYPLIVDNHDRSNPIISVMVAEPSENGDGGEPGVITGEDKEKLNRLQQVYHFGRALTLRDDFTLEADLATSETTGVVKPGRALSVHEDGTIYARLASDVQLGVVRTAAVADTCLIMDATGVISNVSATKTQRGVVKTGDVAFTSLQMQPDGTIQAHIAEESQTGVVRTGNVAATSLVMNQDVITSVRATDKQTGVVQTGDLTQTSLRMNSDGKTIECMFATPTQRGVVQTGDDFETCLTTNKDGEIRALDATLSRRGVTQLSSSITSNSETQAATAYLANLKLPLAGGTITGDLVVDKDVTIHQNLQVDQNVNVTGNLAVKQDVSIDGTLKSVTYDLESLPRLP